MRTTRSVRQQHVARATGLSVAAVSRALSGDSCISEATRRRVQAACRKLGYRRIRRSNRFQIALVAFRHPGPQAASFDSLPSLALGRTAASQSVAIAVYMIEASTDAAAWTSLLEIADHADGLILYGHVTAALLKKLARQGIRHVVLGPPEGGISNLPAGAVAVTADMVEAGRLATQRLIVRGHRRIAFLCPEQPSGMYYDLWLTGYQLAHLRAGLPVDPDLVFVHAARRTPGSEPRSTAADAVEWMRRLRQPPTAWVIPGILDFLMVRMLAPKAGLELSPANLTLGGRRTDLLDPLLAGWPMVAEDIETMIDNACSILRNMVEGTNPPAGEIQSPLQLLNFETEPTHPSRGGSACPVR
jgi:DNA-binding LacI/PurR family transcriptional regulator